MRKLVIAVAVLAAAACDATRRDYGYCDTTHACQWGYSCDLEQGICRPGDAGAQPTVSDVPLVSEAGGGDILRETVDLGVETAVDVPIGDTSIIDQSGADGAAPIDASQPIDVPPLDTRIPDAVGSCSVDNDCVGVSGGAFCVKAKCVACKTSTNCNNDAGVPFCSAQNACVSCAGVVAVDGGAGCSGTTPVCNASTGSCVECVQNSDCPTAGKGFCVQHKCVGCDVPGATASPSSGGSDGGTATAGACTSSKPVCVPSSSASSKAGQCVGCAGDTDCKGTKPICDTATAFTCGACTSDLQCANKGVGPGICMFVQTGTFPQDGRCASEDETIYVQNSSGCSGGGGTAVSPFCQPQLAINAVSSSKRVIVMSGTAALGEWNASLGAASQPVYVVGRNNPTVSVGAANIGIHIVSGAVYIRGITVQGSGTSAVNPGIVVDSGAILGLDRCTLTGNAGGLLVNDGAGFDIAISVFVQNQSGSVGAAVFGGAYLGSSTATTLPHRFWFNTVADNQQFGVACTSKTQALDGCLLSGDAGGEVVNCTLAATTKSPNRSPSGTAGTGFSTDNSSPLFSTVKSYHLTATTSKSTTSPCKDFITDPTVLFPPDDIDGQARPYGTAADCGADEYWP